MENTGAKDVPTELVTLIFDCGYFDQSDLRNLAVVASLFRQLAQRLLFRTITVDYEFPDTVDPDRYALETFAFNTPSTCITRDRFVALLEDAGSAHLLEDIRELRFARVMLTENADGFTLASAIPDAVWGRLEVLRLHLLGDTIEDVLHMLSQKTPSLARLEVYSYEPSVPILNALAEFRHIGTLDLRWGGWGEWDSMTSEEWQSVTPPAFKKPIRLIVGEILRDTTFKWLSLVEEPVSVVRAITLEGFKNFRWSMSVLLEESSEKFPKVWPLIDSAHPILYNSWGVSVPQPLPPTDDARAQNGTSTTGKRRAAALRTSSNFYARSRSCSSHTLCRGASGADTASG